MNSVDYNEDVLQSVVDIITACGAKDDGDPKIESISDEIDQMFGENNLSFVEAINVCMCSIHGYVLKVMADIPRGEVEKDLADAKNSGCTDRIKRAERRIILWDFVKSIREKSDEARRFWLPEKKRG